ncbi:hypothetical protein N0V88_007185 [Collariella sp. IMI 366227]|nr:hypothetical protein N0V88_007185 [Collariella sp. IMI 366227]
MKLPTLAILALCQLVGAQVSTVNGVAQFAGTPVQQNPHGIPTLIYNCAKLPAICQNVNRRNPLTPRPGAGFGALQGATHVELHYDTNSARKNGDAGYNAIANAAGMHSGMMWTCDEWPPATAVEGGAGANTICAPQNAACAPLPAGVGGVDSEQNFQSSAHTALRQRIWSASNPNGIFRYHFKTVWYGSTSDAATQVEWYMPASEFVDNYGNTKRFNTEPLVAYKVVPATDTLAPESSLKDVTSCHPTKPFQFLLDIKVLRTSTLHPLLPFIDVAREFITSREENQVAVAYIEKAVGEEFCVGTSPTAKCQQGFGRCETVSAPTCGGSSATGRTIGYYQVGNVRDRQCNRIRPAQIKTEGLTHLYLAFASIDPNSLKVIPANADDVALYKEFTALKSSKLQTWVAIGGWDFSDPGPTRTAFNDAARTPARRKTFINSLVAFLTEHGFQGVDIDWEYPGAPDRGGTSVDTDNYVTLIKEMRAAFGTKFGISMAIPASYWYLRWFKPKEMEPYVDWFGIMTYDLHGPWDKDVKQIGTVVLGHTNIPEIANWTLPLWYDGVNPAKVNMGLAYYSRGYTLADANCNSVGCQWKGPSRPGQCTNFGGVHSLQEIQRLITQLGVQPKLLAADMMKQLTFGDQWIGYDDMETIAMKRQWANNHCFGGTMIWSVDMFSGSGSGDTPDGGGSTDPGNPGGGQGDGSGVIYIDPSIYEEGAPEVKCQPPCTFILPPKSLTKATTITFPPYVTSLDVAWSASTGWTSIVQTTTITIPPVTTTEIEVWAYTVSGTRTTSGAYSTFRITPSIRPSPFTIKDDPNPLKQSGVSHPPVTRTITPPPWPYTYTPPGGGRPTTTSKSSSDPVVPIFPIVTWKPGPRTNLQIQVRQVLPHLLQSPMPP